MDTIPGTWLRLLLAVLATWRITHLLAAEDGPAGVVAALRSRLGASLLGSLMDCFGCMSLWVALPLAFYVAGRPLDLFLVWPALSGGAFLLERGLPPPLTIHGIPESDLDLEKGGPSDELLRPPTFRLDSAGAGDDPQNGPDG